MIELNFKVEGLAELEQDLALLNKEYGGKSAPKVLRPAIKQAISPIANDVEANTPVDSGALRDSIKTKIGKPTKKMLKSEHYSKDTVIVGRTGWFWTSPSLWNQALAVEFGNASVSAQSVLRNALDSNAEQALDIFKRELATSIEKKAKSFKRLRMKGKL